MREITQIMQSFRKEMAHLQKTDLKNIENLNNGITISKECLYRLRLKIRDINSFPDSKSEISFFKTDKPFVLGYLKYFVNLHAYMMEKPTADLNKQRLFINKRLEKLEDCKKKQLIFWNYYKHNEERLDHIYFIRGNNDLAIVNDSSRHFSDPEFSTSHDNLVGKFIAYDLLVNFYNDELLLLKKIESGNYAEETKPEILKDLSWTATKTDLVEIIYALQASGALRNGQAEISRIANVCSNLFEIDLGNVYKTYSEIKSREIDRTKFIDKLKVSLETRMNYDDSK